MLNNDNKTQNRRIVSLKSTANDIMSKLNDMREKSRLNVFNAICEKHGETAHHKDYGCMSCKQEKEVFAEAKKSQWSFFAPEKHKNCTVSSFNPKTMTQKTVRNFVINLLKNENELLNSAMKDQLNVIFSGNCGTGKTHLAVAMCKHIHSSTAYNVVFANVADMLTAIKATYKYNDQVITDKEMRRYTYADFLVLDEAGLKPLTEHDYELLYTILNNRYEYKQKQVTLIITNMQKDDLNKWWGDRISSRMQSLHFDIIGADARQVDESKFNKYL